MANLHTAGQVVLHITSEYPCLLSIGGQTAGETRRDLACHLEAAPDETLLLAAVPLCDTRDEAFKLLPAALKLALIDGRIDTVPPGVVLSVFPDGQYEVLLKNEAVFGYMPALAVDQAEFTAAGTTHTVTVFRDALNQVLCEGGGQLFQHIMPEGYRHRAIELFPHGSATLIRLTGALAEGGEYVAYIGYDGLYSLHFHLSCEKWETEGEELQALVRLNDIAQRGAVLTYAADHSGRYVLAESYLVYLLDGPRKPAHSSLAPFSLFESVKCGDYAEARALLSPALNEAIEEDDALRDFFAAFELMEPNRYFPDSTDTFVLKSPAAAGRRTASLLKVRYADGLVDDLVIE